MMRVAFKKFLGLFIDDGTLALALILFCAAVALGARLAPALLPVGAPVLLLGCSLILLVSVARAGRRQ